MRVSPKAAKRGATSSRQAGVLGHRQVRRARGAKDRIVLESYAQYWNRMRFHFDKVDLHADTGCDGAHGQP